MKQRKKAANSTGGINMYGLIVALSVVFVSFLVATKLYNYKAPASLRNSKVVFDPPQFDFGNRQQHELIDNVFHLLNRGENPAFVVGIHTTCSCTLIEENVLGKMIPPHGAISIPVSFDTGLKEGDAAASVTIYWQVGGMDSNSPVYESQASLQGKVFPEFVIEPRTVDFGELKPGEAVTNIVAFYPGNDKNFTISDIRTTSSDFKAALINGGDKSAKYKDSLAQLAITFYAPKVSQSETLNDIVHFTSTSKLVPSGEIPVRGTVMPDIEVIPEMIVLPSSGVLGLSDITIHTHYPSRISHIVVRGLMEPFDSGGGDAFHVDPETYNTAYHWRIPNTIIASAKAIDFELEVRNESGRVEARSASVLVKRLN